MDTDTAGDLARESRRFNEFLDSHLKPHLSSWYNNGEIATEFFGRMAAAGWFSFGVSGGRLFRTSAHREAMVMEETARLSPGVAVAVLAHLNLGFAGLYLYGSETLKERYGEAAAAGQRLMCLGNTENIAGSDVAGIGMTATQTDGGWLLNGTKAYVTNGAIADLAVVTAVSDPRASRNRRLSMFLIDLDSSGVRRRKLNKQVWIPSDLTRLQFDEVFVPGDHLLGERGRGLQQVLSVFTLSRVPISALTLGTAEGAFDLALGHALKRKIFGKRIVDFQAKAFEFADFYARIEAARLMVLEACRLMDQERDYRLASSLAKYLTVQIAREVAPWAADLFGAASVIYGHPIHKFPMDAWGASLGEGTQDVQKLVIFREMLKKRG
jgi:alkylation response protein AidB-like acyl-CoA dehydrogenase